VACSVETGRAIAVAGRLASIRVAATQLPD
jgi:hypothetical protein